MNYRHGYHAGNFADVVKHIALVAILLHLKKKDTGFAVVDSHGGRGAYDLGGEQAGKTGEAEKGVARLTDLSGDMPQGAFHLSVAGEKRKPLSRFAPDRRQVAQATGPADGNRKTRARVCGVAGDIGALPQCRRGTGRRLYPCRQAGAAANAARACPDRSAF